MEALYFGSSKEPLFGVYEPPVDVDRREGVVLCIATGDEYYRLYRPFRALAHRFAAAGAHVLRFDYIGTGNSGGEASEYGPAQWVENVDSAIEELKAVTGLRTVCLVGLHAGGVMAAHATRSRDDVERLVLWEPWEPHEGDPSVTRALQDLGIPSADAVGVDTLVMATKLADDLAGVAGFDVRERQGPVLIRGIGAGRLPLEAMEEIVHWSLDLE